MFFLSGAASLIYQTIWIRKFSLVLGGTVHSMSVVVSTFMAGLAIGAAVLGRVSDRVRSPLRLYALIELAIAAAAVILNFTDGVRARMVAALIDTPDLEGTLGVRVLIAVLWLGLPCFLIGGTLPVMVRFIVRRMAFLGRQVGALYFVNTLGAALGALATGVALVEVLGLTGGTLFAGAVNVVVALVALLVVPSMALEDAADPAGAEAEAEPPPVPWRALVPPAAAFFLSGFCALVLEMGWTRLILGFLRSGALVVSLNLSLVLLGFALGGIAVSRFADSSPTPTRLASLLFGVTGLLALVGLSSVELLGLLPVAGYYPSAGHLAAIFGIVFPASVAMGSTFPLLARLLVTSRGRIGTQLGGFYALNTVGTVLGGLAAPFVLIPAVGTSVTVILGALLQVAVSLLLWVTAAPGGHRMLRIGPPTLAVLALALLPSSWDVYRRTLRDTAADAYPLWSEERAYVEGADSTVVLHEAVGIGQLSQEPSTRFRIQVNAAQLVAFDSEETKLMAHLPLVAVPEPKRALVICFGMGNTFRSALAHGIEVDVVDINPAIPGLARIHQPDPARTFEDPRGRIHINDGRNFLQVTRQRYDMITVDPAPPIYSLGQGNIQSREFYQLISDRLTDAGVAEAWMVANSGGDFVRTLAAFRAVFPHVAVFRGMKYPAYHVLGSRSPIRFSEARIQRLVAEPRVLADLSERGASFFTPQLLRSLWVTDETGVDEVIRGVEPLTDDRPVLEYRTLRGLRTELYRFPESAVRPFPAAP
jgi:spermidine synthase